jgi:predicted S18 family serine protease
MNTTYESFEEFAGSFEEFATSEMDRLNKRVELLISGPGGIMEMKQTIADKEQRIEELENIIEWSGLPWPEEK